MRSGSTVSIIRDPVDPVAAAPPVHWAVGQVQAALKARGVPVRLQERFGEAPAAEPCLWASGPTDRAREVLAATGLAVPADAESSVLASGDVSGRSLILACGGGVRGLVYALLEVADRVVHARNTLVALDIREPLVECPANRVRSVARIFASDVEDRPWYADRSFWTRYLSMLTAQRFNRFSLTLGLGYDFLREVSDSYFHFAYPFLVTVPGYNVRALGLPEAEREHNLAMLRFISDAAAERGLHFQLGLWTHGYAWADNPGVNYVIEGLTPENHAAYCRDALRRLLQACPAIQGVTFRIHGESGVPEGTYAFWKTVFEGIVECGRRVEIDLHPKGIDQAMIDIALETGMPVNLSPKYWAEHMGLPYHQAAIRTQELPPPDKPDQGFFGKSGGSRRFLRYGYGDLLAEDRRYGVLHRLWPGTQRLLLWGDPAWAAAYSRASAFCGSVGMEICEPLSFKGRKGSGLPGGRDAYADSAMRVPGDDWEKYRYTYRLWGRLLYNPEADSHVWRRSLDHEFGSGGMEAGAALAHASRILPLVTTAHLPSAANNGFWPEVYTNMPVVDAERPHPYHDTPTPKHFGTVSPLDPELFSPVEDFVEDLLSGEPGGRYNPLEVAQWLEDLAAQAGRHLAAAQRQVDDPDEPSFRRLAVDVAIQSGLGHFFAGKLRAAVLYALYERTSNPTALQEALQAYQAARAAWAGLSAVATGVYVEDITFGRVAHLRGHWADRLAAIDQDIADMGEKQAAGSEAHKAAGAVLTRPQRPPLRGDHTPPAPFRRGAPVDIDVTFDDPGHPLMVCLRYRQVNQVEPYRVVRMEAHQGGYRATIPGEDTDSPYPLQYHFELKDAAGAAWLYPGFNAEWTNQPYFIVRQACETYQA